MTSEQMTPEQMWEHLDLLVDTDTLELRDRAWTLYRSNQAHERTRKDILDWLSEVESLVTNEDALGIIYGVQERFGV